VRNNIHIETFFYPIPPQMIKLQKS
jgi:hypothetical protein